MITPGSPTDGTPVTDTAIDGDIEINGDVTDAAAAADAIHIGGTVVGDVTINANISGGQDGIEFTNGLDGDLAIEEGAKVTGGTNSANGSAILLDVQGDGVLPVGSSIAGDIINHGDIAGAQHGIYIETHPIGNITNYGTIVGDVDGDGIGAAITIKATGGDNNVISNETGGVIGTPGEITKDAFDLGTSNDLISNEQGAAIYGNIHMGSGGNGINNSGLIQAGVINQTPEFDEPDGIDIYNDELGTLEATDFEFGSADDRVENHGIMTVSGVADFHDGENNLYNNGNLTIEELVMGVGDDEITNDGEITGNEIALKAGLDIVTNNDTIDVNTIKLGDDADKLTNNGLLTVGRMTAGEGDDTIHNTNKFNVGELDLGEGSNTLSSYGGIFTADEIISGEEADEIDIQNGGALNAVEINLSGGNDKIFNSGTVTVDGELALADGENEVENDGYFQVGELTAANDADVIDNKEGATFKADLVVLAGGADEINNDGVFEVVEFDAGAGSNSFNNLATGQLITYDVFNLGNDGSLNNGGLLNPGGFGVVQVTEITGDFIQDENGITAIDVIQNDADRLNISGNADLDGVIDATFLVEEPVLTTQFVVVDAVGGVTDSGIKLDYDGILPDYLDPTLLITGTQAIIDIGFSTAANTVTGTLNQNQTNIVTALNDASTAGGLSTEFNDLYFNLFLMSDTPELADALDQLSPEIYGHMSNADILSSLAFTNDLFACDGRDGRQVANAQGYCFWLQPGAHRSHLDATFENLGYTENLGGISAGALFSVALNWRVGGGFDFERGTLDTTSTANNSFNRFQAGVSIEYTNGAWLVAVAISGGIADNETSRAVNFGPFDLNATSSQDSYFGTAELRAAYVASMKDFYLKPSLDLAATTHSYNSFTETGAGVANLTVDGTTETVFTATPTVEIGVDRELNERWNGRAFVAGGATLFSNASTDVDAAFSALPGFPFVVTANRDQVLGNVEAGFELFSQNDFSIGISYQGQFGENTAINAFEGRLTFTF
ncbi:autotransporter outer membrane beta-barrel domain-containing protein [Roseibium sp. SCP14]|uniref:autotransporter outer membrane beta-barrel domain-containing protein n=1 Tax=Roseibium sp. SCP14 TaxID=3141375 RepID=UPI0033370696